MHVEEQTEFGVVRFEARADLREFFRTAGWWGVSFVIAMIYAVATDRYTPGSVALVVAILTAMVVGGVVHRLAVFQITDTHVVKRRPARPALAVARSDIAEAVVADTFPFADHRPRVHLLDRETSTLLTSLPLTDEADIHELAAAAPQVSSVGVLILSDSQIRWPKLMPWWGRTRQRFVLVIAGAVLGMYAVAGVVIWTMVE